MKLVELDDGSNDLVLLLRNLISQANDQQQPSYLSWRALNKLMQNIGSEQFDYDSFKTIYDDNPMLKQMVHRFDGRGIELKTKRSEPNKSSSDKPTNVDKMAKAAIDPKLK